MSVTIRALSHIVMPVADFDGALAFYRDLLGLEMVMQLDPEDSGPEGSIAAGLRIAGVLVPGGTLIELVEGMEQPRAGSTVVALNVADVRTAQRHVEAAGVTPSGATGAERGIASFYQSLEEMGLQSGGEVRSSGLASNRAAGIAQRVGILGCLAGVS